VKREDFHELCQLIRVDARVRVRRESECSGKHPFGSFEAAKKTMSRELAKVAKPYHCKGCGKYHIGNVVGQRRGRLLKIRRREMREEFA
jgi:hypothetical protein